jgi:hypothetical protein
VASVGERQLASAVVALTRRVTVARRSGFQARIAGSVPFRRVLGSPSKSGTIPGVDGAPLALVDDYNATVAELGGFRYEATVPSGVLRTFVFSRLGEPDVRRLIAPPVIASPPTSSRSVPVASRSRKVATARAEVPVEVGSSTTV